MSTIITRADGKEQNRNKMDISIAGLHHGKLVEDETVQILTWGGLLRHGKYLYVQPKEHTWLLVLRKRIDVQHSARVCRD